VRLRHSSSFCLDRHVAHSDSTVVSIVERDDIVLGARPGDSCQVFANAQTSRSDVFCFGWVLSCLCKCIDYFVNRHVGSNRRGT
jgi:hypothetical protein